MRNAGLEEAQTGIKIARRNINNFRYADDTILRAESEEELKSLLMKVKEEGEKVGLKLNIQQTKIIASGPITSWQIDGQTVETVADFILGGSKITVDYDCSHEIKRCLLLWRKVMTNLDSILKSRDITLSAKVHLVKAMVFPVVMYGCDESEIAQSCLTLCDPMDCRPPGSSSMGFSRQEYWSGLPFPSPGDLSDPGIELWSPALQANALTWATREDLWMW